MLDAIAEKKLANGLKIICLKKSDAPVVSAQIWYRCGSFREHNGIRGITHILEHMMFRGSANVATEEHARRISDVGGHCNAFTMEDVTSYQNSVPKEHLGMALALEADRMQNLILDKDIFETERAVIIEEYHTYMNNPVARAFLEFRTVFYASHPYQVSPLGTIDDIQAVTRDDLAAYYRQWYRPDNAVCVIVGDFERNETVFEMVAERFAAIPSPGAAACGDEEKIRHAPGAGVWMKRRVDFDVPIILSGYPAPDSSDLDSLPLDILQAITSQGETSRMNQEIVRKRSLAVMAGGMNHSLKHAGMSLFFAAFTPDMSCRRVEKAIHEQIELVKKNGVTDTEMEKVKNITLTGRTFELFSAEQICQRIGFSETVDGDYRVWVRKLDELASLDRDRLVEVAKKYWRSDLKHTLYLKPKKVKPLLFAVGLVRRFLPKR